MQSKMDSHKHHFCSENVSNLISSETVDTLLSTTTDFTVPHTASLEQFFRVSFPGHRHRMPVKQ